MLFPNAGAAQIMSVFCHQTHYWEAIESIFIKYLGCEIQGIEYSDQLQALLKLTDENIVVLVQYYKDTPNKYCPWQMSMEIKNKSGVSTLKADIIEWENDVSTSWMRWSDRQCNKVCKKYEKVVEEIINLLEPICIGSN